MNGRPKIRLVIAAAALLALCVIGLRALAICRQQLDDLQAALAEGEVHAQQFAETARERVTTIRLVAESYLDRPDRLRRPPPAGARRWLPADGVERFADPDSAMGGLLQGAVAAPTRGLREEVEAATALDPLFRVTVGRDRHTLRAFYASLRGFASTHPWWPFGMSWLGEGHIDLTLFDLARPNINPLRDSYWLGPTIGTGGGLVATVAAPVYEADRLAGVVGLEVALAGVGDRLSELGLPFGTVYLVDRQGRPVAAEGPRVSEAGYRLPALSARAFHFVEGDLIYRLPYRDLPLTLVYRAPATDFALAVAPPLAQIAAVLLFVAVVVWLAQKRAGAEQAQKESEELFRVLVETAPVGLSLTRIGTGKIVALNPVACRMLGITAESAGSRSSTEFYADPADRERMLERVRSDGTVSDFEVRLRSDDGRVFWSHICGAPTRYRGETVLLAGIMDVTARKLAEQRLRLSEERHRAIFSTASVGIVLMDAHGRFVQVNQAWSAMLGHPPGEAGGRAWCEMLYQEDRDKACSAFRRMVDRQAESVRVESRFVRRDGSLVWGDFTAAPICGPEGDVEGVVAVVLDVTARRAHEAELEATRRRLEDQADELRRTARHLSIARREAERALMEAEQANHAKSHFLAAMSHELRTPLNAILGFSQLIRDRMFGPDAGDRYARYAGDVYDAGSHLLDLINDILDISKIEAGKLEIDRAPVKLRELLEGVIRLVKVRADAGGLTLDLEVAEAAAYISADERALKQIAFNLLSNAIKFTPPGGRILVAVSADDDRVEMSVSDSGIGIPQDALRRVMQPFEQLDNRYDRPTPLGGSGLGLSLVQALAALHGGEVRIESTVNVGTRVTVTLPRAGAARTPRDPADRWVVQAVG